MQEEKGRIYRLTVILNFLFIKVVFSFQKMQGKGKKNIMESYFPQFGWHEKYDGKKI